MMGQIQLLGFLLEITNPGAIGTETQKGFLYQSVTLGYHKHRGQFANYSLPEVIEEQEAVSLNGSLTRAAVSK